ncbi:hypothetical protein [Bradyrhizobium sp. NP1]|uniref:hypothetical protein n=1 Tax=Bradyrhizobium sp. NP1 TaxID=3049772 RepID=UPI0025A548E5|nr:hypothetical protein [Bradyrhizobium sp. NP1]WJR76175.1 hypothetical protein QOU61_25880 [Bradyrhizobium sp. NP1]
MCARDVTVIVALALALGVVPAKGSSPRGPTIASTYSSTAPAQCRAVGKPDALDGGITRVCLGKGGFLLLVSEGDLRETVSVGRNRTAAAREPAASARFGPFNSSGNTVEWRTADGKPFAIIQGWQLADNADADKDGRPRSKAMLVVTRLPPGPVCHVAYVDVAANREANALARQAADQTARDFDCRKDAVKVIGASGRAVELTQR